MVWLMILILFFTYCIFLTYRVNTVRLLIGVGVDLNTGEFGFGVNVVLLFVLLYRSI